MLIKNASDVPVEAVRDGISIQWLITEKDAAPNFAMRSIEIQPGVVFPPHQHPYEHEIYVLEGEGVVTDPSGDVGEMTAHKVLLVSPDEKHGYRNTGKTPLKFICVIPLEK